jgi:hypothetical protein
LLPNGNTLYQNEVAYAGYRQKFGFSLGDLLVFIPGLQKADQPSGISGSTELLHYFKNMKTVKTPYRFQMLPSSKITVLGY